MYRVVYEDEFGSPYTRTISSKELHSELKALIENGCYICHIEYIEA